MMKQQGVMMKQQGGMVKLKCSPASPVGVFQGYDTVTDAGLSKALTGKTETTGGNSSVRYRVCSGIQEVRKEMGITQSLTASFWSTVSISEKLEFADSLHLTTYSTCIVVSAKHVKGKETATNWRLDPNIKQPKDNSEVLEFFTVHGDSFVSSRTLGGEYYAVYTFYAETQEKQSELQGELRANGLFSVASVDASVQGKLSKMSSTQTTRVSLDQIISGIANPRFPGADGIIQFAQDFPSLPLTSPVVTNLETTGYERVEGLGTKFRVIAANRRLIVDLTPKLFLLKQLQNDINNINDIYSFYGSYAADTRLVKVKMEAEADTVAVRKMIAAYEDNATQPLSTPELRSLANGTPSLRYKIQREQRRNEGVNGCPFNDIDRRAYLQKKTRISALQFRLLAGGLISYYKVTYTDTNGSWVIEHGDRYTGDLTDEVLLSPGRVVISAVSGNIACEGNDATNTFWRSIGFKLSDDRQSFFGSFPEGYRWEVPRGYFLLGFGGSFSSYLCRLDFIYASFDPASWPT